MVCARLVRGAVVATFQIEGRLIRPATGFTAPAFYAL
jgi:hypothetical protein